MNTSYFLTEINIILDKTYGGNLESQVVKKCHNFL